MEKELLSRLPEELIHSILGLLTTKDAVKASLASKSLQASWLSSCPVLDFHDKDLHKYVSNTMEMVSNHTITRFAFWNPKLVSPLLLDKWIGIALDCHVRQFVLRKCGPVPYCLPQRVLSSSFLKSLSLLCGGESELSLLHVQQQPLGGAVINLPCLQMLTLRRVRIDEESLQRLLRGCPSLKTLYITPPNKETLSQLNIYHLKLKYLNVCLGKTLDKIEVEAPCLEEFHYTDTDDKDHQTKVIVKSTSNLKSLSLHFYSRSSMEWLSKLLPRCTSLEALRLDLLYPVKTIFKISNRCVKNIAIDSRSVDEIEIDCPMLLSLCWIVCGNNTTSIARGRSILLPSLSAINCQPNFVGHLQIRDCSHTDLNTAWFHKLREFLSISRMAAMSFCCLSHSEDQEADQDGDNESLLISPVKIKQLYLMVRSGLPESCYSFIIKGFLSTCHPDTIHLAPPPAKQGKLDPFHFIEFFRKKLENWKGADGCYCSSKIKCWKHQLKRIEIGQEFSKLEDKERDHYSSFKSISKYDLQKHLVIRLKFQWC